MEPNYSKKKIVLFVAVVIAIVGALVLLIGFITQQQSKNEYGNGVTIQNYDQKVKNLPKQMRDGIEAYLYNILQKNTPEGADLLGIKDAYIREESDSQVYTASINVYSGNFIVDIESLKQSYYVQYSYSSDSGNLDAAGDAVVISCLEEKDLKYGAFDCFDFISQQASKYDAVVQYLPYENFSFRISADATGGDDAFKLVVELRIPESGLSGDTASRQAAVALYKNEVLDWIRSKGLKPEDFTIEYNYSDDGTLFEDSGEVLDNL